MKIKRTWNLSILLLLLLLFIEVVIWTVFTGLDKKNLQIAFDETLAFSKVRLQEYRDYTANDRVKSLVRLLDKTTELGNLVRHAGLENQQELDDYVSEQRLAGTLILDENLNIVSESLQDESILFLWKKFWNKDYVRELLEHPEETYSERIKAGSAEYDIAMIHRADASGLIFACSKKGVNTAGEMTLDSVFADFPVSMNGVIAVSLNGKVVSANQSSLLEKNVEELRGTYRIHEDFVKNWIISRNSANGIWYGSKDKVGEYTVYVFFPASQIFMTRFTACILYTAAAVFVYLLVLLVQSNAEKAALKQTQEKERVQEQALRNALAAAEHANRAKTNFLNSISHDIRTPMNAVIGFTALASTHMDNPELVLEYLKKISISSQHLLSLINDVLDMSRIESGVVKLEEVKVHLPDVFHDLRAIIQGNICAKQLELYIDTQNVTHEDIITDKLRLNQVLLNIVSNAIKFTQVGGMINIRVTENPCQKVGYASYSFSVKDNGIGMSEEFQEHIYDAFSREQTVTKSGIQGTGLGMAISKNIINMMGGTIEVHSKLGKGSEFIVTLECRISEETVKYKPVPELQGTRALVVDDDANTCMSVCKMLRDIEMIADWTTSGKEAVLRAKEACDMKKEFRAYIIDWQMPDMNGIETVRRIRKVIGNDAPIIILTAYDWADIADEAKEAGVTAFVSKPLFMSELRAALTQQAVEQEPFIVDPKKQYRHAGRKVLLVEDNELNQEIAIAILEEAGLTVDAVNDGTDAVARMESVDEGAYDLILMDIQMPKMDGYTATREIRTLGNNKKANIPIIAMTANAFEEDKKKAFEAGMNAHISKPINREVILHTLDQIFGNTPQGFRF